MPNWCENETEISGPIEDLQKLINNATSSGVFQMQPLLPTPELTETANIGAEETVQSFLGNINYQYKDVRNWTIANWGTKWDLSEPRLSPTQTLDDGTATVSLSYLTAWSPNINFWLNISKDYPTLTFNHRYWEEGVSFIGEATIHNKTAVDKTADIETEMYLTLGAVIDSEGEIDWDNTPGLDFNKLFPLDETLWDCKIRTAQLLTSEQI